MQMNISLNLDFNLGPCFRAKTLMQLLSLALITSCSHYCPPGVAAPLADKPSTTKTVSVTRAAATATTGDKSSQKVATSAIDPSVIDPVRQLQQISAAVKASRVELSSIAAELDKVNHELDRFEGKPAKDIDRKQFALLGDRFNSTLARSGAVEKKVSQSLAKSLKDIDNVKAALKRIQSERLVNKNTKHALSDSELKECLKDLSDLDKTVRELQTSLKDAEK